MNITQLTDAGMPAAEIPKPADDDLQREYDYILAENLTKKLLERGLISVDEFTRIMAKNRDSFSPFLARFYT